MENDFQLGEWVVRPGLNTVSQNGSATRLEPKVMEVLVCLASRPGEPISKETIIKTVWADTFVSDDVLIRSISELRRVFGDDARESRVIETVPKRGYRLLAAVSSPLNGSKATRSTEIPRQARKDWPAKISTITAVSLGVILLLVAAILVFGKLRPFGGDTGPVIRSLAVLPFENLSDDPKQEYLARGLTDALITNLAQISALRVVSRTTIMRYEHPEKRLPEIARELNADAIVEGTVQRSGDRVRFTVQLIEGGSDKHLWASTYERNLQDTLTLQAEIAAAIAQQIKVKLTPQEQQFLGHTQPVNLKAIEPYLEGRYHYQNARNLLFGNKNGRDADSQIAIQDFENAIAADPNYAPAYVGLAKAWFARRLISPSAAEQEYGAIMRALAIDPRSAEAHMTLGRHDLFDWKWDACGQEYRQAIELNPNLAEAHAFYAEYLLLIGHPDESFREAEIAKTLDPANDRMAWEFYGRRQFDRFIELKRNDIASHMFGPMAHYDLGFGYERAGRRDEAVHEWQEALAGNGFDDLANALKRGYAAHGFEGGIREWVAGLEKRTQRGKVVYPEEPAYLYALLGDKDRAFAWLEKAYQQKTFGMPFLKIDPTWDDIRSDSRFAELERRVGVP